MARRSRPDETTGRDLLHGVIVAPTAKPNQLLYGDNLTIMRQMGSNTVDLIYLDPPFNSQRSYNLIYKQLTGLPVPEQVNAFCDAWELDAEKDQMARDMPIMLQTYGIADDVVQFWSAWIKALRNTQPELLAYLVYMTYRLFEMRRVLKPNGSIYLHCDPTASHYIKIMMDAVFGHANFRSEIIWKRTVSHNNVRNRFGDETDTILAYSKGPHPTFNIQYRPYSEEYIKSHYSQRDADGRRFTTRDLRNPGMRPNLHYEYKGYKPHANGWAFTLEKMKEYDAKGLLYFPPSKDGRIRLKRYLDEMPGTPMGTIWDDISPINSQAIERLGYPTQKPIALLERIIKASSNEGDVVFDPFAGCGTAIYAAHANKRRWIGCDIAILSVRIVREVLSSRYGLREGEDYCIEGVPSSVDGARYLAGRDKTQFQHWAVELSGGFCNARRSGDQGVDGRLYFETRDGLRSMVLSVKGGETVNPSFVRDLRGTMEADNSAEMAGLICLEKPTKGMLQEAAKAGMYRYASNEYPRLQIRTIEELLDSKGFATPSRVKPLNWDQQIKLAI